MDFKGGGGGGGVVQGKYPYAHNWKAEQNIAGGGGGECAKIVGLWHNLIF